MSTGTDPQTQSAQPRRTKSSVMTSHLLQLTDKSFESTHETDPSVYTPRRRDSTPEIFLGGHFKTAHSGRSEAVDAFPKFLTVCTPLREPD